MFVGMASHSPEDILVLDNWKSGLENVNDDSACCFFVRSLYNKSSKGRSLDIYCFFEKVSALNKFDIRRLSSSAFYCSAFWKLIFKGCLNQAMFTILLKMESMSGRATTF